MISAKQMQGQEYRQRTYKHFYKSSLTKKYEAMTEAEHVAMKDKLLKRAMLGNLDTTAQSIDGYCLRAYTIEVGA
jgi:hypothetical protein